MAATEPLTMTGEGRRGPLRRSSAWLAELVSAALLVALVGLGAARFVTAERTLYRADQVAYWSYSSQLAAELGRDPLAALQAVAWSVAESELNLLPSAPVAGALLLFGDSRLAYVLAVIAIYGLATTLAHEVAIRGLAPDGFEPRRTTAALVAAGALLLFPTLWRPALIGYLGLGGVAIGIAILALYLRIDHGDARLRLLLLLGFLVALLVLFRRWYGVWAAAFGVVLVVDGVWHAVRRRFRPWRALLEAARPPALVAVTAAATMLLLAGPVTLSRLTPGYLEEFAAFTHHRTLGGRLAAVVDEFGLLPLAAVVVSAAILARRPATRRIGVLLPLHTVVAWGLMVQVQDHSPHHWYLYLAAALLLVGLAGARLLDGIARPGLRAAALAAVVAAGLLVSAGVFVPALARVADAAGPLLPVHRVRPQQRTDLAEVERLLRYLDGVTADHPGPIYVLGNTGTLSEQTLAFANRSLGTGFRSPSLIAQASHVDRRDGFPSGLLVAGYVVVPQPAQISMGPEDQQVILIPNRSFVAGEGIARAFRRLPEEFLLEGGVRVWVFRRERPNSRAEAEELAGRLRERYPDRPDIWQPPGIVSSQAARDRSSEPAVGDAQPFSAP